MLELIKNPFSKENLKYSILIIVGFTCIIINRIIVGFGSILCIADIGSLAGIISIIFMAKHNVWGYVFNIVSLTVVIITGFIQHIWLNATISLVIMLPNVVYGLITWIKNEKNNNNDANLKALSKKALLIWWLFAIVLVGIFTFVLWKLDGNLFYLDAMITTLCVIGTLLCSRMYLDNYYFFIPANIVGMLMYTLLSIQNINNLPYIITYVIYTIVSVLGLMNWLKLNRQKNIEKKVVKKIKK